MRIKSDIVAVSSIPRTVFRCKTYRNLSKLTGTCGSSSNIQDKIIEEEENEEMVEENPITNNIEGLERPVTPGPASLSSQINGIDMINNHHQHQQEDDDNDDDDDDDDESDKEIDNDEAEADDDSQNEDASSSKTNNASSLSIDPPEIKVTIDDSLQQMAHEYRKKFNGFAELYHFETIEEFYEFIKSTIDDNDLSINTSSNIQDSYIKLLINEKPNNKFNKLLNINRTTLSKVLIKNQDIIKDIYETANFDDFPKSLIVNEDEEINDNLNLNNIKIDENMKKWYMIELIGIWLKNITDIDSYRDSIKKIILKNNWGIENDRYNGIAVPLNYK